MEKRGGTIFIFLVLGIFLITSINASVSEDGYNCLENKIDETTCEDLSLEEQVFSVLATGKCAEELRNNSIKNGTCWAYSGTNCNMKLTSLAALALGESGYSLDKTADWILKQNITASNINWYLQINSKKGTNCTLNNSEGEYNFRIGQGDTLEKTGGSNNCFSIESDYRIKVSQDCHNEKFGLSCDSDFQSSFLFESGYSSSIFVSDITRLGSADETIEMKVNSLSFSKSNYEDSLWAAMVLDMNNRDISSYLPPLITGAEASQNQQFLPDSFLYFLTGDGDYSSNLISIQNKQGYWDESGDSYYDTAIALFPFTNEEFSTKPNATNWLIEQQNENGCWDNGDIVNTAFILFSNWPKHSFEKTVSTTGEDGNESQQIQNETITCESQGGFCMSDSACGETGGEVWSDYECKGWDVCCSENKGETSCADVGGTVCESDKKCSGNINRNVVEENCCVNGECQESEPEEPGEPQEDSECVSNFGNCRESCLSEEEEANYSCTNPENKCCISAGEESYMWLWIVLGVLVISTIVFIFRKKISRFFREKFGKGKKSGGRRHSGKPPGHPPGHPPGRPSSSRQPRRKPSPRPQPQGQQRQPRQRKGNKELDKTLNKLKKMSK